MKKILIFMILVTISLTLPSTSETFAFDFLQPKEDDDPYTTQTDDIVFEDGDGSGTITRMPEPPEDFRDKNWSANISALDFNYNPDEPGRYKYIYNAEIYQNKIYIPLNIESDAVIVDECSSLQGYWLSLGETTTENYVGDNYYYYAHGEKLNFYIGDYYYYEMTSDGNDELGYHKVYETFDICIEYEVVEAEALLTGDNNYLHWTFYSDEFSLIDFDIYIFDAYDFMETLNMEIATYETMYDTTFFEVVASSFASTGITSLGIVGATAGMPKMGVGSLIAGAALAIYSTEALADYMVYNQLSTFNDFRIHYMNGSLEDYIIIKIGTIETSSITGGSTFSYKHSVDVTNSNTLDLLNGFDWPFDYYGNISFKTGASSNMEQVLDDLVENIDHYHVTN